MRATPQFARMVDEQGVEVQPDYGSQPTASELLPLTAKSDAASEQFLTPTYHQLDGDTDCCNEPNLAVLPVLTRCQIAGASRKSCWPMTILIGLVLLAVVLVVAVIAVNPGVFKAEFRTHFLLVSAASTSLRQQQFPCSLQFTLDEVILPQQVLQ